MAEASSAVRASLGVMEAVTGVPSVDVDGRTADVAEIWYTNERRAVTCARAAETVKAMFMAPYCNDIAPGATPLSTRVAGAYVATAGLLLVSESRDVTSSAPVDGEEPSRVKVAVTVTNAD